MNAFRSIAPLGLTLALCACATSPPPPGPAYIPAGVAERCGRSLGQGFAQVIREKVACQLETARHVDLRARDLAAEFRRANTMQIGRSAFVGVADDLIARWAADPTASLAPRPGFRPVRVEGLEFKATPAIGADAQAFDLRGRLISTDGGRTTAFALTGRLLMARGGLMLAALDLTPAPIG